MTTNADTNTEKGAALILVALSLFVLVGFAALAIDGGLGIRPTTGDSERSRQRRPRRRLGGMQPP